MNRICPQCEAEYGPEILACPEDGTATDPAPVDELIGRNVGSYVVTKLLGKGGMGSVYLAEHPVIRSRVAIKFLHSRYSNDQKIVDRFFNEARAVNLIGHENILKILDLNRTEDGHYYFTMELLDGRPLEALLEPDKPLDLKVAGPIMLQFCEALQAAHERGIFHRDVKPDNVYLVHRAGRKNFVKVVDFGIAKLTDGQGAGAGRTQTGMVIGTPAYMSPEQAGGQSSRIDARSDVYSTGVMLFQIATGRLPFAGESFGEVLIGHLQLPPPDPRSVRPDVPESFARLILKCLEKRHEDRFQSMRALSDAIGALLDERHLSRELPVIDGSEAESVAGPARPLAPLPTLPRRTGKFAAAEVVSQKTATAPKKASGQTVSTKMELAAPAPQPTARSRREQQKRKSQALWFAIAGGVVALLLVGGIAWRAVTSSDDKEAIARRAALRAARLTAESTERALREQERNGPVLLTVQSEPPGAMVDATWYGGGEKMGQAPLEFRVPRGARVHVVFSLDGFQNYEQDLIADENQSVRAALGKAGGAAVNADGKAARRKGGLANSDDVVDVDKVFDEATATKKR